MTPRDEIERACPFCDDTGYDGVGLKVHLSSGHCEAYEATRSPARTARIAPAAPAVDAEIEMLRRVESAARAWWFGDDVHTSRHHETLGYLGRALEAYHVAYRDPPSAAPATEAKCPTCHGTRFDPVQPNAMWPYEACHACCGQIATPRAGASEGEPVAWCVMDTRGHVYGPSKIHASCEAEALRLNTGEATSRVVQRRPYRVVPLYARPTPPPASEGVEARIDVTCDPMTGRVLDVVSLGECLDDVEVASKCEITPYRASVILRDLQSRGLVKAERAERGEGGGGE